MIHTDMELVTDIYGVKFSFENTLFAINSHLVAIWFSFGMGLSPMEDNWGKQAVKGVNWWTLCYHRNKTIFFYIFFIFSKHCPIVKKQIVFTQNLTKIPS